MLCEEWGLIIALLSVACIVALSIFAVRVTKTPRSAFYTTAACAATSLLVFQTILNVLGCVDILPLTGVTFPFVSVGGSSMIASWGLLAFLKAADTREDASFAVRSALKIQGGRKTSEYEEECEDEIEEQDDEADETEEEEIVIDPGLFEQIRRAKEGKDEEDN